ncbi:MAG: FAD:protein FMN transferase [Planctomycetes bacterium]|nr:FAD:protein FMN transferase [Planctomycetota bacterium]
MSRAVDVACLRPPAALVVALALTACGPSVQSFAGPTMGSTYQVKFVGHERDLPAIRELVADELAAFDAAFSQWRDDSEIARLNATPGTEPVAISARFAGVLRTALEVAAATDGAFDPTVKPLSDLYRAAKKQRAALDPAAVAAARQRIGFGRVTVTAAADGSPLLVRQRGDVLLDLDGLVAGAAADAIGAQLRARGTDSFYLEITGEVLCHGVKPDGEPWRIGVVDPAADVVGGDAALRVVALRDRALCTSGDYRNALVVDGKVVHHVFDPRTGRNPTHSVVSASVLADSAAIADALGTALMVMGDEAMRAAWPRMRRLGAVGALLVTPAEEPGLWRQIELDWPPSPHGD